MIKPPIIVCLLFILLGGCSTDTKLFGYTLWGGYNNSYAYRPSFVRVQKGDTLYSISRAHDVPIREVIETNSLKPPYTLKIGQIIRLPQARYHIVAKGDTLYSISRRYNVDMPVLSKTNDLQAPFTLKIGQKLLLPGSLVNNAPAQKTTTATIKKEQKTIKTAKSSSTAQTYAQPSTKRKNKFAWPVKGQIISKYGPIAKGRNNDGINIKAAKGTPVKAADSGTVAYAGNELKGFGNLILIKHSDGWVTAYAHNDSFKVKKGQSVKKGDVIATVGTSGGVDVPQVHFETRAGKKALNPQAYLP